MKKLDFTRIEADFDSSEGMKGLIYKMKALWSPFLIEKGVVKMSESQVHYPPTWKPASYMLNQTDTRGWASCLEYNYFEIEFTSFDVLMTGYSFKADANEDSQPRYWNVTCVTNNVLLANVVNNNTLCPNAKFGTNCGTYQVVKYKADRVQKCRKFRFSQTGLNAAVENCFAIASFEMFGIALYPRNICTSFRKNTISFCINTMIFIVYSF